MDMKMNAQKNSIHWIFQLIGFSSIMSSSFHFLLQGNIPRSRAKPKTGHSVSKNCFILVQSPIKGQKVTVHLSNVLSKYDNVWVIICRTVINYSFIKNATLFEKNVKVDPESLVFTPKA